MMRRSVLEATVFAHKLADEIAVDCVDLELLDSFLMSDRAPSESMMLSDLDGFLTGIAVGPELVLPSEWLPLIWGGEAPEFADEAEAKAILGTIMGRYNEVLRQVRDDAFEPVFWADRDGTLIAADWAEGFLQAIMLRADAWRRLLKSKRDGLLLLPILALCGDVNGNSLLGLTPDQVIEQPPRSADWPKRSCRSFLIVSLSFSISSMRACASASAARRAARSESSIAFSVSTSSGRKSSARIIENGITITRGCLHRRSHCRFKSPRSTGRLRAPGILRHPPVDAFQQVGELRRRDRHRSIRRRWPEEATALQPLGE